MKKFFHQYRILPFLLALLVTTTFSYAVVHAQTAALSGDEVCGRWNPATQKVENPCTIATVAIIMRNVLSLVIILGLPLLVVFITYRFVMAWFALQQGNAGAYKDALQKSGSALLGFFLIVALFGGLLFTMLRYFGVSGSILDTSIFKSISSIHFIERAYAAGETLPNPISANNLYDLILNILRLVVRFFIYPALIMMWVWSGFAFVFAQGRPEAIMKAKKWLMWAFLTTLVIFLLQAFLVAVQGTVEKILPSQKKLVAGESCLLDKRIPGTVGDDGVCHSNTGSLPTAEAIAADPRFSPTYCSSCIKLKGTNAAISGGATLSGTAQGYSYYSDGTVIGPDGTYYRDDKPIWSPPVYTCPDGKTKYFDQSDYRIMCSSVVISPTPYNDPCPSLNQVHSSCTAQNGKPGTCLLDVFTKPKAPYFVCVPK